MVVKKCFKCKIKKPLDEFQVQKGYSRPSEMGRTICCNKCNFERAIKEGGYLSKESGKFEFMEASEEEIIKHFNEL